MQARIWDLDARFHGQRHDSGQATLLTLRALDRAWNAAPGYMATVPVEYVTFAPVEIWVPRGRGGVVCYRWVRPEFRAQFDARLHKLEQRRRGKLAFARAMMRADRVMNPPRFMPTIGGGEV